MRLAAFHKMVLALTGQCLSFEELVPYLLPADLDEIDRLTNKYGSSRADGLYGEFGIRHLLNKHGFKVEHNNTSVTKEFYYDLNEPWLNKLEVKHTPYRRAKNLVLQPTSDGDEQAAVMHWSKLGAVIFWTGMEQGNVIPVVALDPKALNIIPNVTGTLRKNGRGRSIDVDAACQQNLAVRL